jgi:uracil-DNA glycosylase
VLRVVSKSTRGIVFLAWGSPAQKRIDSIGVDKTKHCILRSVHPSPLSASRGFFDCRHFIKANEWLKNRYGVEAEVEWDCLAEGKQGRGLPGKEPSQKEDKKPVVAAAKETVTNNGKTLESSAVVVSKGRPTIVEDADEFDDEELDKLLSG